MKSEHGKAPHNSEVERALLAALLVAPARYDDIADFVRPVQFYVPVHGRIYEAIATLIEGGQDASVPALRAYFEDDDDLRSVGGGGYIRGLADDVVSTVNAREYGELIADLHTRRALISVGRDLVTKSREFEIGCGASDHIEWAEQRLYELGQLGGDDGQQVSMAAASQLAIESAESVFKHGQRSGLQTGWRDLDKGLGGLRPGNLVIVAGSTSMGKTALALNLASQVARKHAESGGQDGAAVAYFSLEMSAEELSTRVLADVAGVPLEQIRAGSFGEREYLKLLEAQQQVVAGLPLTIDQTAGLSVAQVRTRARRLQRKHKVGLVVVDYLQLLSGNTRAETRVQEVTEITRGLKAIAKELNVPLLALSQLNRSYGSRDNKRPQLSDLKESGSIEQDADVVLFVHRDHYYVEREKPMQGPEEKIRDFLSRRVAWEEREQECRGKAEILIAKQRQGPTGSVHMRFDASIPRFSSLSREAVDAIEAA